MTILQFLCISKKLKIQLLSRFLLLCSTFTAYLSTSSKTPSTLSASETVGTVFGCIILLVAVVWFSVFAYFKYTRPVRNRRIADLSKKPPLSQGFMMDTVLLNSQRYSLYCLIRLHKVQIPEGP